MAEYTCNKCGDYFAFTDKGVKCPNCGTRDVLDSASEQAIEIRLVRSINEHTSAPVGKPDRS